MRHFSGEFEGLRLLMADELDLIAGGEGEDTDDVPPPPPPSDGDDIVVTARRTGAGWAPTPGGGYGGGGSGSDGPPTDANPCPGGGSWDPSLGAAPSLPANWDYHLDWTADKLAASLEWDIKQRADHTSREYAGFIWRDNNGSLHTSNLAIGTTNGVDFSTYTPQLLGFSDWSQVVGIVHNHPAGFGPSAADMAQMKYFADLAGGPSAEQVRTYISTASGMKEYNYLGANVLNNNTAYEAQEAARRAQQSGNYHPERGC